MNFYRGVFLVAIYFLLLGAISACSSDSKDDKAATQEPIAADAAPTAQPASTEEPQITTAALTGANVSDVAHMQTLSYGLARSMDWLADGRLIIETSAKTLFYDPSDTAAPESVYDGSLSALSNDGSSAVFALNNGNIVLANLADGTQTPLVSRVTGSIGGANVKFAPTGAYVAIGYRAGEDTNVGVWSLGENGDLETPRILLEGASSGANLAFTETHFVFSLRSNINLYDLETGVMTTIYLTKDDTTLYRMAAAPDSEDFGTEYPILEVEALELIEQENLLVYLKDDQWTLYDILAEADVAPLEGATAEANFSPIRGSNQIRDRETGTVWSLVDGQVIEQAEDDESSPTDRYINTDASGTYRIEQSIEGVTVSQISDDTVLATIALDGTPYSWDTEEESAPYRVAIRPDGAYVVISDQLTVYVYAVPEEQLTIIAPFSYSLLYALLPEGDRLILMDQYYATIWDVNTGERSILDLGLPDDSRAGQLNPPTFINQNTAYLNVFVSDEDWIVSLDNSFPPAVTKETVLTYDSANRIHQIRRPATALSPNGNLLALWSAEGSDIVYVWNVTTGEQVMAGSVARPAGDMPRNIITAAFSADSSELWVSGYSMRSAKTVIFDLIGDGAGTIKAVKNNNLVAVDHSQQQYALYNPDTNMLEVRLMDDDTLISTLPVESGVTQGTFSPNGRFLAVRFGAGGYGLYDITGEHEAIYFEQVAYNYNRYALPLVFNPDNTLLAYPSWHEGGIHLNLVDLRPDVETYGTPAVSILPLNLLGMDPSIEAEFLPDGRLLTASTTHEISIWGVPGGALAPADAYPYTPEPQQPTVEATEVVEVTPADALPLEQTYAEDARYTIHYPAAWLTEATSSYLRLATSESAMEQLSQTAPEIAPGEAAMLIGFIPELPEGILSAREMAIISTMEQARAVDEATISAASDVTMGDWSGVTISMTMSGNELRYIVLELDPSLYAIGILVTAPGEQPLFDKTFRAMLEAVEISDPAAFSTESGE